MSGVRVRRVCRACNEISRSVIEKVMGVSGARVVELSGVCVRAGVLDGECGCSFGYTGPADRVLSLVIAQTLNY